MRGPVVMSFWIKRGLSLVILLLELSTSFIFHPLKIQVPFSFGFSLIYLF